MEDPSIKRLKNLMKDKRTVIVMEIMLILLLLTTCLVLNSKRIYFENNCKETYNPNDICPCVGLDYKGITPDNLLKLPKMNISIDS